MRKITTILFSILMILALTSSAFAAPNTYIEEDVVDEDQLLEYKVDQCYYVIIPAHAEFAKSDIEGDAKLRCSTSISVFDVVIAGDEKLVITVSSAEEWTPAGASAPIPKDPWTMVDKNLSSNPVHFEMSGEFDGTPYANDDEVLSVACAVGNNGVIGSEKEEELFFSTKGTAQEGDYMDMLTFTVNIVGGQVTTDSSSAPASP